MDGWLVSWLTDRQTDGLAGTGRHYVGEHENASEAPRCLEMYLWAPNNEGRRKVNEKRLFYTTSVLFILLQFLLLPVVTPVLVYLKLLERLSGWLAG